MKRIQGGSWEMTTKEKENVKRTGILDDHEVDLERLMWVEVNPGLWRCWFLPDPPKRSK